MMLNKAQKKASKKLRKRLDKFGLALLWGQIRSGKTRPFLDASRGFRTLVITKLDAIGGILSEAKEIGVSVDVINYHSAHKKNPDDYDLIVLDECHLYISQAKPKHSPIWENVVKFTRGKHCIFASGTPTPETLAGLYHMLALSTWTPFPFDRFTHFFDGYSTWKKPDGSKVSRSYNYSPPRTTKLQFVIKTEGYGVPSKTYLGDIEVPCYKKTQEGRIMKKIDHLIVPLTRVDTGHVHEAVDKHHTIKLGKQQSQLLDVLETKFQYIEPCLTCKRCKKGKKCRKGIEVLCDTPVKILGKHHQVAGGIGVKGEKVQNKTILFSEIPPKVQFIIDNFDPETTIILAHYKHEQEYLAKKFPHTGSVTKMSTGKDLSHYKTMVIYSMAFSSANYEQVRGRLMNVKRLTPIVVHYLLSGIDNYVIEAVRAKENFTSRWYKNATGK